MSNSPGGLTGALLGLGGNLGWGFGFIKCLGLGGGLGLGGSFGFIKYLGFGGIGGLVVN